MDYQLPENNDKLLEECDMEMFRSGGPGGQNVNRRETAVRLRHRPTGIAVSCQQERSQYRNKMVALEILRERIRNKLRHRKRRIQTSVSRSEKEKRLQSKKQRSAKKKLRKKPTLEG